MARRKGSKLYNQFVRGLITEANALTFPENASYDELNFELLRDGSRRRRRGLQKAAVPASSTEESIQELITDTYLPNYAVNVFRWEAAGGSGDNTFIVTQIGETIYFWNTEGLRTDYSIILDDYSIEANVANGLFKCQFAAGKGRMFVTNQSCQPFFVSYDPDTDTFTDESIKIFIRDFEGVDDELQVDERPETLTQEHKYNLRNQGWNYNQIRMANDDFDDPIPYFYWWTAKKS